LAFLGGLEFNATRLLRMAEVTSNDPAIDMTIGAHQSMGLKVIYFCVFCFMAVVL